jgi:predicted amidohydrolase
MAQQLTVALISEVYWQPDGADRLRARLRQAKALGAELALLPEIPMNRWSPATQQALDDDAEPEGGPRTTAMADAARDEGIGIVGGIIARDPQTGRRTSRALVFDAGGEIVGRGEKLHLPEEPGFWETSHYEPGTAPAARIDAFGLPFGIQICSDINRPEGTHLLGAAGAMAVLAPRSTEQRTYERWRVVFRANALTSCAYVLSVNRPAPEQDVLIGGASVAVDPNGQLLVETTEPVAVVTLEASVVEAARKAYPGYLPVRARIYSSGWSRLADRDSLPAER